MVWVAVGAGVDALPALAVAMALTVLAGALMVSRFAYWSFKGVSPRGRISFAYVLIIPLIFVLIAIDPPRVCFALASIYASSGIVIAVWRRWRRQSGRTRRNERPAADE
jgi:CDP-diacylglycerol--serine O-phosphatidyltransferase